MSYRSTNYPRIFGFTVIVVRLLFGFTMSKQMVLPGEKRNFSFQFIAPLISFHTFNLQEIIFSNFSCFSIPILFSNLNYNCSNLLDIRNLQEQVKKAFCNQKLFYWSRFFFSFSLDYSDLSKVCWKNFILKLTTI